MLLWSLIHTISSLILLIILLMMLNSLPYLYLMFLPPITIPAFLILPIPVDILIPPQIMAQSRENIAMLTFLSKPLTILLVLLLHSTDINYKRLSNYYLVLKYYYHMSQKQEGSKPTQYTRKKIEAYSYGLLDEIGKGYSSRVYRGRHDQTEEEVAVKVIDLKLLKNEINRELLNSEIEILRELKDCENILRLSDIFTTKNNTYIITELCGSDLSKLIKKTMKEEEVLGLMNAIINGYLEIYRKNIVHRDLKPANILITEAKEIKIADFGFAVKVESLAKSSKYNVGSPLYMAPQSLKKNEYSFKSDIWALGVILYEMLFNDTPWRAKNEKDLLKKIENEAIEGIISSKQMNAHAKQFLVKCLTVDKHTRMSPAQLQSFNFPLQKNNILGEKIMNSTQKPCLTNQSLTFNSPNPIKSFSIHQKLNTAKKSENVQFSTKKENITATKEEQQKNQQIKRQNKKLISKILISQVHFCRFLFKLLQKIGQSEKYGLLKNMTNKKISEEVYQSFAGIIKHKICDLTSFRDNNFIECQGYKEYKKTSDYQKIVKISTEYCDRYRNDLQKYWDQEYSLNIEPTNKMIIQLYELLDNTVKNMANPEEEITVLSREVIILDYLITARQLIDMIKSHPSAYEKFARKSRIQQIVEGKTVEIHYSLYTQIMQRVKQIMEKKQFISFGGEMTGENYVLA